MTFCLAKTVFAGGCIVNEKTIVFGKGQGMLIPGQIKFGRGKKLFDLSPINLLSPELDPRVTYRCASEHFYWSPDGLLEKAAPDVWPLEYQNGVAVGRHEPEPARNNVQFNCRAIAESANVIKSGDFELIADPNGAPDGGPIGRLPVASNSYMVSQDINGVMLVPATAYKLPDNWKRLSFTVTSTARSRLRLRMGLRLDENGVPGPPSIWLTQNPEYSSWLTAGMWSVSWFAKAGDKDTFPAGLGQIEEGAPCTSPIITEGAAMASRAGSSVTITTAGASSIVVHFNNGQSETHETPDELFSLPVAPLHWGTRYITLIEYEK